MRAVTTALSVLLVCSFAVPAAAQTVESGAALGDPAGEGTAGGAAADSSAPDDEAPRLIVLTSALDDAPELLPMVRTQLPGWQVQPLDERATTLAIQRLESQLRDQDALLWLEAGEGVVHVVVTGHEGRALSSPIPTDAAGEDLSRVYALAAVGLLNELWAQRRRMEAYAESAARIRNREVDELRERREENVQQIARLTRSREAMRSEMERLELRRHRRWFSPLSSRGWSFRLGWVHGFSPRHEYYEYGGRTEPDVWAWPTAGARISLAGRFRDRFQVGGALVTLHADGLWNGSLSAFASVHSRTRCRIGMSAEIGLLVARESDENSEIETSWASVRFYLPLELGVAVNEHGGVFLKMGPLITRAPDSWFVGYDISVEWEFD